MMRIIDFDGDVAFIPTTPEQLLAVAQAEHERQQPGYRSSYDEYVDEELRPLVAGCCATVNTNTTSSRKPPKKSPPR
jgi:hypothetical protein